MMVMGCEKSVDIIFDIIDTRGCYFFRIESRRSLAAHLAMQTWDLSGQVVL